MHAITKIKFSEPLSPVTRVTTQWLNYLLIFFSIYRVDKKEVICNSLYPCKNSDFQYMYTKGCVLVQSHASLCYIPYSGKFSLVQIFTEKRADSIFAVFIFADAGHSGHTPIS